MLGRPVSRRRRIENFQKNSSSGLTMDDNKGIIVHVEPRIRQVAGLIVKMSERGVNGCSHVELEVAQRVCRFVSEIIFQDVRKSK